VTQVKQHIRNLEGVPTLPTKITNGPLVLPPDPAPMTAARQLWEKNFQKYRRANDAVGATVITATNAQLVALKTWLKNNNSNNANGYLDMTTT
jgi:hypothetical protein